MWCPELRVLCFTGSRSSRQIAEKLDFYFDLYSTQSESPTEDQTMFVPKFNVLVTSYETFRNEIKIFLKVDWQIMVIDEGQRIKNDKSQTFKKTLALRC